MPATLLKGKPLAREIEQQLTAETSELRASGTVPNLTVVLVGDDPASKVYVSSKGKACGRVGIESNTMHLPATLSEEELLGILGDLNSDRRVHGILVQLPLPEAIDTRRVLCTIEPRKDVDGFTPENTGRLLLGFPYTVPCTPAGIVALLERYEVPVEGSDVVVIGRSNIVGKPLAALLMQKAGGRNCTVTVCHSRTKDIGRYTREADIVVAALGRPGFLTADMVREGSVVVDVGISRIEDASRPKGYRLAGDADFDALVEKTSFITPVPGGVGPLTVAMLLKNTVLAARASGCGR